MHAEGLQLQCPVALPRENGTIGTILINTAVANEGLELVGFVWKIGASNNLTNNLVMVGGCLSIKLGVGEHSEI